MNVVYFTTRLYRGVRAELLVRTAYFQFIPGIPGKQTITLRLNPNPNHIPKPNPNPKPNPKSHHNPNNQLIFNSYPGNKCPYPSGIVYQGHLYAGESGQFRPLIFLGPVRSDVVRCGVSSERYVTGLQYMTRATNIPLTTTSDIIQYHLAECIEFKGT